MSPDKYIKNYIDGALIPASSGNYLDNINPSTSNLYAYTPDSDTDDLQRAVESAQRASKTWGNLEPQKRFRILIRIADILEQNLEEFAKAETVDAGKPLSMTRGVDIPQAQANFRYYATSILHQYETARHQLNDHIYYNVRQPIGIIGCIAPWNMPLHLLTAKIAPALAAGNCVIAKPSSQTPMSAYLLSKACMEAGLPKGVLNILHGKGERIGMDIVDHPKIKAITFTGSITTGRKMITRAAPHFKKLLLELGGNNPCIIFEDCDFEQMIIEVLHSAFSNNGQLASSTSRIYIERPIYQRFKEELVKRTQFLKVGDPFSGVTDLGALISEGQLHKIENYINLAEVEGGTLLCGGSRVEMAGAYEKGYFIRPSIIEGLDIHAKINQETVFGPIVTIAPFDNEEEVLKLANFSNFGLSAIVWTQDISRANRMIAHLQHSKVWVNSWSNDSPINEPLHGLKSSGFGGTNLQDMLQFFTVRKQVSLKY